MKRWRNMVGGWGTLGLALAQCCVFLLLSAADAYLDARSFEVAEHVEAEADCSVGHDELYCQLIRSLVHGTPAPKASRPGLAEPQQESAARVLSSRADTGSRIAGAAGPRAPPLG